MSTAPLLSSFEQLSEDLDRQGRLILHQLKRHEELVDNIKEECEKDNIELFRNIHKGNQLLEQLHKTVVEREESLHYRITQLEAKVQKISDKINSVLDILQRKL